MWSSNPTWGKPRIQAELRKIGIEVSDSTVSRYRPPQFRPPSQTWRSFLENHVRDIVAIDFFVVPTARFRVLYVFLVMSHDRRRILHLNVTTLPSAQWTAQQMVEAFPYDSAPRYVLHDRDSIFSERHLLRVLRSYASYYHSSRTHRSLDNDGPNPRPVEPPEMGDVVAIAHVGGLHHWYCRHLAA